MGFNHSEANDLGTFLAGSYLKESGVPVSKDGFGSRVKNVRG